MVSRLGSATCILRAWSHFLRLVPYTHLLLKFSFGYSEVWTITESRAWLRDLGLARTTGEWASRSLHMAVILGRNYG